MPVDAVVVGEEAGARTIGTQTENAYTTSQQPLSYIKEDWFSFEMLHKILQLPHYEDFTPAQTALLRNRFFSMRVVAEPIVKAKTCVCCGVVGHSMDACPVRIGLTSYFSKEPITKSLFGTVKGIQAGYE